MKVAGEADMKLVDHPIIVIGIPCYNEERLLKRTLLSVQRQAWTDFAVLISDNASTDRTAEVARAFCATDPRFHYHRQAENIGSAHNFNFTAECSVSRYLLWLGAHDLLEPEMLGHHIATLERRPEVSVSQSAQAWVDVRDHIVARIDDGDLDGGGPDDAARYLRSVGRNTLVVGVNSVIRRAMLGDMRFTGVIGTDRILLSHLAFRGPFATSKEILYLRRTFDDGRSHHPYMERLTGRSGGTEDWSAFAREYDRDFARLLGALPNSTRLRKALALRLRYYFPVERRSLLTQVLWTVRRVRKWLGLLMPGLAR